MVPTGEGGKEDGLHRAILSPDSTKEPDVGFLPTALSLSHSHSLGLLPTSEV